MTTIMTWTEVDGDVYIDVYIDDSGVDDMD